jgi:uncharacterized membrane protein YkoI
MIKILIFCLFFFTLTAGLLNKASADNKLATEKHTATDTMPLDKIKQQVGKYYEGKIIAISSPKNKKYFLVSILKSNGKVESIKMDKISGDILK